MLLSCGMKPTLYPDPDCTSSLEAVWNVFYTRGNNASCFSTFKDASARTSLIVFVHLSYIYSFVRGITLVTRNGFIVRARRAGGNLCNLASGKRQQETKKGMVLTLLRRCSFHVFVAYRVYSPIRLAVSMETRGKTYRFSLFGLL